MRRLQRFFAHRWDTTSGMLGDLTSSLVLHLHSVCNILELTSLNASDCLVVSLRAGEVSGSVLWLHRRQRLSPMLLGSGVTCSWMRIRNSLLDRRVPRPDFLLELRQVSGVLRSIRSQLRLTLSDVRRLTSCRRSFFVSSSSWSWPQFTSSVIAASLSEFIPVWEHQSLPRAWPLSPYWEKRSQDRPSQWSVRQDSVRPLLYPVLRSRQPHDGIQ